MGLIDNMLIEADNLISKVSSGSSVKSCFPVQERFSAIVEGAMKAFKEGKIQVDVKALPLPMYFWATEELPEKIKNPENFDSIVTQLKLFKNSINHILNPKET